MENGVVSAEPKLRSRGARALGAAAPTRPPGSGPAGLLSQTAEFCRAIVEGCDDAIIIKTLDGIVTSWNPGAERIFGYAATEMIGRSIKPIIPAELLAEDHFVLLEIEQGHRIPHFDTVRIAKDGRRISVSLAVSPIHDSNGVMIGASKIARDIGERKRAEAAAKAANQSALEARQDAERANRAKTEFLAAMSREMRAPLTSIAGLADLLLRCDDLTRDQRRHVEMMRTANDALRAIADDMLDVSKADLGKIEGRRRSLSPTSMARDGARVARAAAADPDEIGEGPDARILVVDDLDASREIVEAYLDGRGYRVDSVGTAIDAIQMLGTETFDLVLMDIQMPIMDGVTATKRIRSLPKPMSDVPILAMTGNALPVQIKSFLDAGMNGHIAKPISPAKLHESVRRWGWRRGSPPREAAPSAPVDQHGTIDEFVAVVGAERARKIANDFANQLNGAFRADCAFGEARRQAHDLVNCAGFLGLGRFVGACQALECHPAGDAASESSALARIRAERDLARDILSGHLLPSLRDRAFRPTGQSWLDLS